MNRQQMQSRLKKVGLAKVGKSFREALKRLYEMEGSGAKEAEAMSWTEMWEGMKGEVGKLIGGNELQGIPADRRSVLDRGYSEPDRSKQLRDGLLWAAMNFSRVVRFDGGQPVARFEGVPLPPNEFALLVLETYALSSVDKRRELVGRALQFASKAGGDEDEEDGEEGGFLEELLGEEDS